MMRSIATTVFTALLLLACGCARETAPDYGVERALYLSSTARQTWAVAPVLNLSGQREVDPILQADLVYGQVQQVAGLNVLPVNRVVEVYRALKIDQVQSEEQAALVCQLLGCDALLVGTVSLYDPYDPPRMGASLQLFRSGKSVQGQNVDPRELARRAAPPPLSATAGNYSVFKAFHVERNRIYCLWKWIPRFILVLSPLFTMNRYAMQAYAAYTRQGASSKFLKEYSTARLFVLLIQARLAAVLRLPRMLAKRRAIQRTRTISVREWYELISRFKLDAIEIALKL